MALTLLKIVQDILSAMDSDEVNSIGDTVESRQVATVVETVYRNILARTEFEEHHTVFELKASGDPAKPNLMVVPNSVDNVQWVKYNIPKERRAVDLKYLPPTEFLEWTLNLGQTYRDDLTVSSYTIYLEDSSFPVYFRNDDNPYRYTFIPGIGVLFDAVDLTDTDTLQKNNTIAYGRKSYEFELEDDFVPPLDTIHFNLLYQESKALAFAELKQTQHATAERAVRDSRIHAQRRKDQSNQSDFRRNLPNYGRNSYAPRLRKQQY